MKTLILSATLIAGVLLAIMAGISGIYLLAELNQAAIDNGNTWGAIFLDITIIFIILVFIYGVFFDGDDWYED